MLDKLIAHRHIQWLADKSQLQDYNMTSGTNIPVFCRNTRQGRTIVTDDQGLIQNLYNTVDVFREV